MPSNPAVSDATTSVTEEGEDHDQEACQDADVVGRSITLPTYFLWTLVRVAKKGKDEFGNEVLYPAGHRGNPGLASICLFCSKRFNGTCERICSHVAQVKGSGILKCGGASKTGEDTTETSAERKRFFIAARERCASFLREKRNEKESKRERELLHHATSRSDVIPSRPHRGRQTSITAGLANTKQKTAEDALGLAIYLTDIPFHALDNDAWKEAFNKIALCGTSFTTPSFRALGGDTWAMTC
ncbi:hypothetical protein CYMTET_43540 [Cymbomonas tetramitiformis]|uniref:Uncharacterized protein n=1 Tax=Cymbomonas tetramitiformis TaxID=36881 RepID=A0AAE0F1J5_9CHLO|nr:hypothetical protein CYMTET_43540 [Cymbomonas tetramitiformis]